MSKIDLSPPSGTRDYLPQSVEFRERTLGTLRSTFELFGFRPLETPALERLEVLMDKYGDEGEKLIFKILKRGEKASSGDADLALRYDFTVPLARVVARYQQEIGGLFRRYQIGPVWRADRPAKGRFREFYQCDFDVVGAKAVTADAEVILTLSAALHALGLKEFLIRINSRQVLQGLVDSYGIAGPQHQIVLTAFDKLDKIGVQGVLRDLSEKGLGADAIKQISSDLCDPDKGRDRISNRLEASEAGRIGLNEIRQLISMTQTELSAGKISFDPFLARGLNYYTGPIFEVTAQPVASSIASGGRYDNLIGMFAGRPIPACGGSLGVERILMLIEGTESIRRHLPQVLVTVWDTASRGQSLRIAMYLRKRGISTEVYADDASIGKQVGYASKRDIPFCLLCGPDEQALEKVVLKDLCSQSQRLLNLDEAAQTLEAQSRHSLSTD